MNGPTDRPRTYGGFDGVRRCGVCAQLPAASSMPTPSDKPALYEAEVRARLTTYFQNRRDGEPVLLPETTPGRSRLNFERSKWSARSGACMDARYRGQGAWQVDIQP